MGNLPLSSILGLSMMTFAALVSVAGVKLYNSRVIADPDSMAGPGEVIAMIIGIACTFGGALVHVINLDYDPCLRSSTFGFLAVNLGIGYLFWVGTDDDWVQSVPILIAMAFAGVILGLLVSPGDVQKETKERWRAEAAAGKAMERRAAESSDGSQIKAGEKSS